MSDETGGRRPNLTIEPSIRLELSTRREGDSPYKIYVDDGSIGAFLSWQRDNEIYPFRGGASGGGIYIADFPAEYADAIADYFRSVGLLTDGE